MDILDELKKLIGRLDEEKIEYALCGGLALAVYALTQIISQERPGPR
ncbi:MAG: hypothetical protein AB1585_06925 [Thermodesulfobacteriota bacterium]